MLVLATRGRTKLYVGRTRWLVAAAAAACALLARGSQSSRFRSSVFSSCEPLKRGPGEPQCHVAAVIDMKAPTHAKGQQATATWRNLSCARS